VETRLSRTFSQPPFIEKIAQIAQPARKLMGGPDAWRETWWNLVERVAGVPGAAIDYLSRAERPRSRAA
jgi:hypothetical protein